MEVTMSDLALELDRLDAIDLLVILEDYERRHAPSDRPGATISRTWATSRTLADAVRALLMGEKP